MYKVNQEVNISKVGEPISLFPGELLAKPFLKWAGGKTQLIQEIQTSLPIQIKSDKFTYIEPFVGSGAILFCMIND